MGYWHPALRGPRCQGCYDPTTLCLCKFASTKLALNEASTRTAHCNARRGGLAHPREVACFALPVQRALPTNIDFEMAVTGEAKE
jgi:hypothetical protein